MSTGTQYPANYDTMVDKADGADSVLAAETNLQSSAIEQLQRRVGKTGDTNPTTHEYRITQAEYNISTLTTNLSTLDGEVIKKAIVDAKGDLIVGSAADTPVRLPVGADGEALIADSTQSTGVRWGRIAGGAGIELLETIADLQKQGRNPIISMKNSHIESYMDNSNLTMTLRKNYTASQTSIIMDMNATLIDAMDATTGWTAGTNTPTIALDTTNKREGTGSVSFSKSTISGTVDMYKTFTAFSLVEKRLKMSVRTDTTSSNLTRVFCTLESSSGNTVTYYLPLANLVLSDFVDWTIDLNTTPDASVGTFVRGGVTKITIGFVTSASQTVQINIDNITAVEDYDLMLPLRIPIFDVTNQEWLVLASEGTGITGKGTYTITALLNSYAIAATTMAKMRNISISAGLGKFPSGLSGAVNKSIYDLVVIPFSEPVSNGIVTMSCNFWAEEFKVAGLPGANSTELSSSTDKSGYFKSGDWVALFSNRRPNIPKYSSFYNSTLGKNFVLVQLTADATYASSKITIAHAGQVNTGMDTNYWYAVRIPVELVYRIELLTQSQALQTITPTLFLPKNADKIISDNFDRADSLAITDGLGGNWIKNVLYYASGVPGDGGFQYQIKSNKARFGCSNGRDMHVGHYQNGSDVLSPYWEAYFDALSTISGNAGENSRDWGFGIAFGGTSQNMYSDGLFIGVKFYRAAGDTLMDTKVFVYENGSGGTQVYGQVFATGQAYNTEKSLRIRYENKTIKIKIWEYGTTEPTAYNYSFTYTGSAVTTSNWGVIARIYTNNGEAINSQYIDINNFSIQDLRTYIVRGSADQQNGEKGMFGIRGNRNDTTNQNPKFYSFGAYTA